MHRIFFQILRSSSFCTRQLFIENSNHSQSLKNYWRIFFVARIWQIVREKSIYYFNYFVVFTFYFTIELISFCLFLLECQYLQFPQLQKNELFGAFVCWFHSFRLWCEKKVFSLSLFDAFIEATPINISLYVHTRNVKTVRISPDSLNFSTGIRY